MKTWTRRKFMGVGALGLVAGGFPVINHARQRGMVRLVPLTGVAYPASFLRFANRARFDSVRDALASVRDRSLPVGVAHEAHVAAAKASHTPLAADCNLRLRDGALTRVPQHDNDRPQADPT